MGVDFIEIIGNLKFVVLLLFYDFGVLKSLKLVIGDCFFFLVFSMYLNEEE